jgi:hypothetical protein
VSAVLSDREHQLNRHDNWNRLAVEESWPESPTLRRGNGFFVESEASIERSHHASIADGAVGLDDAFSAADATVLNRWWRVDSKTKPGRSIRFIAMVFGHPRGLLGLIHGFH